ncbi:MULTISPECIES: AraC family transcriptional regulator [unclassified Rhizobium]|jgi:AraC family transcriptional regulator|uniref:AraC family transcriptional regulator n=1 Tax=unclassified Rhizobium TaxID=2613769 RepID=UPI000648D77F|nr:MULTISPECIES: AraC family transcriptional regulator [unclassified Rhizobium]MBN8953428.1 helix-turn-helix transcriptional regulator [Rhizobium tropici]OJY74439.1 MAG: AraC family transcriptional regulator [Rhizobium sp. 60-20]RKD67969.1 AraC family transcriptional regulator [Rhizobium sp. WW_1]
MDQLNPAATPLLSSKGRGWQGLEASFVRIQAGRIHVPGSPTHRLGIHFGRAVNAFCQCDGRQHRRRQSHGDIDIVPAGLDGWWEDDRDCTILRVAVQQELVHAAAEALGRNPDTVSLAPKFQLRDSRLESIAWALKAEIESPAPSDRTYAETLGLALAIRLVEGNGHSSSGTMPTGITLTNRHQRHLADFIEAHIDQSLSLADLAASVGLSVSHLKPLFRATFGMPIHRYILTRRVERARLLIISTEMPLAEIASAAGFAHQSHMTHWMRRILGLTPGTLSRMHS